MPDGTVRPRLETAMTPFVVAAFNDSVAADAAVERLRACGPPTREVRVESAPDVINAATIEVDEMATGGFFGNAARLLDDLFNYPPDDRHAVDYDDLVRKEARVVTVVLDSRGSAKEIADLLTAAGAKRVSTLPQPGLEDD
jgi:hypothetical protein